MTADQINIELRRVLAGWMPFLPVAKGKIKN